MKRRMKMAAVFLTMVFATVMSMTAFAEEPKTVWEFPGFHGSGSVQKGPIPGSVSGDCWYDDSDDDEDDDGGPGAYTYKRGWRYSPGGWWFQNTDGSWPSNGWHYIDSRWYVFNAEGHMQTGWYSDGNGNQFYLNPTDDGTLGSMRIGWQMADGKAYYFNTMSDGFLGRLLMNTTTPDGYHVGADGAMIP